LNSFAKSPKILVMNVLAAGIKSYSKPIGAVLLISGITIGGGMLAYQ